MATKTGIVNVALARAKISRIEDIGSDVSEVAVVAKDLYDHVRRATLAAVNWNFASRRRQLAELTAEPEWGFSNAFALPDDFIRLISAHSADSDYSETLRYRLEAMKISGNEKQVIITDSERVYLRYVFDLTNTAMFSSQFQDAFAWALARDIAAAIPGKDTLVDRLEDKYLRALRKAASSDAIQDYPERRPIGSWASSRNGRDFDQFITGTE